MESVAHSYIELAVKVEHATDKAVLVTLPDFDDEVVWIPWSCVEDNGEDFKKGFEGYMHVAEWFAAKEGFA